MVSCQLPDPLLTAFEQEKLRKGARNYINRQHTLAVSKSVWRCFLCSLLPFKFSPSPLFAHDSNALAKGPSCPSKFKWSDRHYLPEGKPNHVLPSEITVLIGNVTKLGHHSTFSSVLPAGRVKLQAWVNKNDEGCKMLFNFDRWIVVENEKMARWWCCSNAVRSLTERTEPSRGPE